MPFENVHGNGGLLTTVGDLLRWNENFVSPTVGDAAFVATQQQPGGYRDGRTHRYAFGLVVGEYKGVREVGHGGATAGYRAYLARYPDQHLSVAVLCNAASANTAEYARQVADLYLGDAVGGAPAATPATLPDAELAGIAGLYRHTITGETLTATAAAGRLQVQPGGQVIAVAPGRFVDPLGTVTIDVEGRGQRLHVSHDNGRRDTYERTAAFTPSAAQLAEYAGLFTSDEAETTFAVAVEGRSLVMRRRPDSRAPLLPLYRDAFRSRAGLVRFHRDPSGRIAELSLGSARVWDMRFPRQKVTVPDR